MEGAILRSALDRLIVSHVPRAQIDIWINLPIRDGNVLPKLEIMPSLVIWLALLRAIKVGLHPLFVCLIRAPFDKTCRNSLSLVIFMCCEHLED